MERKSVSTFGVRLRQARRRANLPQDRLGVEIGLDEGSASARISRYESGVHEPPYSTAAKLAEVLGVPTAFFYAEHDELANLIQAWGEMSKDERDRLRSFIHM